MCVPPPKALTLSGRHVVSEKVIFEEIVEDPIQKTPEKKAEKQEAVQTTAQKKYELRANNSFISPYDRQESEWTLRILAKEALEVVERVGPSSYREVSEKIIQERTAKTGHIHIKEEKNIKRRVYDALNVMIAIEKLHKKNKRIVADQSRLEMIRKNRQRLGQYIKLVNQKKKLINHKRFVYNTLKNQHACMKRLGNRNQRKNTSRNQHPEGQEIIKLPFLVAKNVNSINFETPYKLSMHYERQGKSIMGDMQAIAEMLL